MFYPSCLGFFNQGKCLRILRVANSVRGRTEAECSSATLGIRRTRPALVRPVLAPVQIRRFIGSAGPPVKNEASTEPPKINMDSFLKNIHLRGKLKSDKATILREKDAANLRKISGRRADRDGSISSSFNLPHFRDRAAKQSINQPAQERTKLSPETVFSEMKAHDDAGTSPLTQDIVVGASVLAGAGNVEGVQLCQKILAEHDDLAFNIEMKLNHYLANALGNAQRYEEAMKLYKQLFYDYPLRRRKITSMFRFTVLCALKDYPCPQELVLFKDFAAYTLVHRDTMPLTHIWQALFGHSSAGAQAEADDLIKQFPQLIHFVRDKLDTFLRKARSEKDSGLLFRMLPLLGALQLPEKDVRHLTGCIYDALMEVYCASEDVAGAGDLIRMAREQQVRTGKPNLMWPDTVKKYVALSGVVQLEVPKPPKLAF